MMATVQAEERIVQERAERQRLEAAAEQRTRTIDLFQRNKQTIQAMMIQFDTLIAEGVYNLLYTGGMGNIASRRLRSPKPGCWPSRPMPCNAAARFPIATTIPPRGRQVRTPTRWAFTLSPIAFRDLTRYRYLLTMQDVQRAAVPFPDNHDDRISRRRVVAEHLREADRSAGARPSTCSSATPRPR